MHIYLEKWQVWLILGVFLSYKVLDVVGILLNHYLPPR